MASDEVTNEYLVEFASGMGTMFALVRGQSGEQISQRYPLFRVKLASASNLPDVALERLRMYPSPNSPPDAAVAHMESSERSAFLARREVHLARVARLRQEAGTDINPGYLQTWTHIDDDAEFRMQMHELWKDDMRYRELPPEQRLF